MEKPIAWIFIIIITALLWYGIVEGFKYIFN